MLRILKYAQLTANRAALSVRQIARFSPSSLKDDLLAEGKIGGEDLALEDEAISEEVGD
jgi:hypothetical protein